VGLRRFVSSRQAGSTLKAVKAFACVRAVARLACRCTCAIGSAPVFLLVGRRDVSLPSGVIVDVCGLRGVRIAGWLGSWRCCVPVSVVLGLRSRRLGRSLGPQRCQRVGARHDSEWWLEDAQRMMTMRRTWQSLALSDASQFKQSTAQTLAGINAAAQALSATQPLAVCSTISCISSV